MKLAILIGSVTSHPIDDFRHPYIAPAQVTDSVDSSVPYLSSSNLKTNACVPMMLVPSTTSVLDSSPSQQL
jgi:hypothetical protein